MLFYPWICFFKTFGNKSENTGILFLEFQTGLCANYLLNLFKFPIIFLIDQQKGNWSWYALISATHCAFQIVYLFSYWSIESTLIKENSLDIGLLYLKTPLHNRRLHCNVQTWKGRASFAKIRLLGRLLARKLLSLPGIKLISLFVHYFTLLFAPMSALLEVRNIGKALNGFDLFWSKLQL